MKLFAAILLLFFVCCALALKHKKAADRDDLLLNYISPPALGIAAAAAVMLIIGVVVACVFDNKGRSGLPKSLLQHPKRIWIPGDKQIREEIALETTTTKEKPPPSSSGVLLTSGTASDEDSPVTAIQVGDMEEDQKRLAGRQYNQPSSRMGITEKHNRIIEAIYQASGRELPAEYRTTKGGAANVHGIRSAEVAKKPLVPIKETDETKHQQALSVSAKTPDDPYKQKDGTEMLEDKTLNVETKRSKDYLLEEKKKIDDGPYTLSGWKDEENKPNRSGEKLEEEKKEEKKEVDGKEMKDKSVSESAKKRKEMSKKHLPALEKKGSLEKIEPPVEEKKEASLEKKGEEKKAEDVKIEEKEENKKENDEKKDEDDPSTTTTTKTSATSRPPQFKEK